MPQFRLGEVSVATNRHIITKLDAYYLTTLWRLTSLDVFSIVRLMYALGEVCTPWASIPPLQMSSAETRKVLLRVFKSDDNHSFVVCRRILSWPRHLLVALVNDPSWGGVSVAKLKILTSKGVPAHNPTLLVTSLVNNDSIGFLKCCRVPLGKVSEGQVSTHMAQAEFVLCVYPKVITGWFEEPQVVEAILATPKEFKLTPNGKHLTGEVTSWGLIPHVLLQYSTQILHTGILTTLQVCHTNLYAH